MASRAWASAEAVTVQVLTTTMSAVAAVEAKLQPRSSNWRSMAAPSACVARQPNCSMKKVGIQERTQKTKEFTPSSPRPGRGKRRTQRRKGPSGTDANSYKNTWFVGERKEQ